MNLGGFLFNLPQKKIKTPLNKGILINFCLIPNFYQTAIIFLSTIELLTYTFNV